MKYPTIQNLAQFVAEVSHKDEIGIYEREDGTTLVHYEVAFPDTFESDLLKECRGIIFDTSTGALLRRPFHKFFNLNEKEQTQLSILRDCKISHIVEKVDGSMIAPFKHPNGTTFWGTKRCAQEFHDAVVAIIPEIFGAYDTQFLLFVECMLQTGHTPLFEFHSPATPGSVVVVRYGRPILKLLAIRNNLTGEYMSEEKITEELQAFEIADVVERPQSYGQDATLEDIVADLETREGEEGVIVTFEDLTMIKIKCPWYVKRHKIKELFCRRHITASLVLDCATLGDTEVSIDDIMPYISESDKEYFETFSKDLHNRLQRVCDEVVSLRSIHKEKRDYATIENAERPSTWSSIVFKSYDSPESSIFDLVVASLKRSHLSKEIRFVEWEAAADKLRTEES